MVRGAARGAGALAGGLVSWASAGALHLGGGAKVRGKVDGVALNAGVVFQQAGARSAHSHKFNDILSLQLSP